MPDVLDANGLQVATLPEIITTLKTGLQGIYGSDINVDSNSPDGQRVNIIAQMAVDIRELIVMVNNGFDPDLAIGRILDQRVPINNINRAGGTFTIQPVDITVNQTVDLEGLDGAANDVNGTGYTVQDGAGNQFILLDSTTLTAGLTTLNFRAKQIGLVNTTINTITNPVTIVVGVTTINNSSAALSIGQNEETDAQLRTRRQQSVAISSTGYLNGLLGDVLTLPGVTDAKLYENVTDTPDINGIPDHGIWLVVEGGADLDIGNEIYANKSYGANMKGAVEVDIVTPSGALFTALFDRPVAENLWIIFNLKRTTTLFVFDTDDIAAFIVENLTYTIGEFAETSRVTAAAVAAINNFGGGGVPIDVAISLDGISLTDYLETTNLNYKWTLDPSRISITVE